MKTLNPQVDLFILDGCGRCDFFATDRCKVRDWQDELKYLRQILLETVLAEEVKWGVPVYTHLGKNIVIISALRECVTFGFFKGVLLKDEHHILEKQGENVQSARIIRFTNVQQIIGMSHLLLEYINEAIALEDRGAKVEFKKNPEPIPIELKEKLDGSSALADAFYGLTPGKQRGYIIYFTQPKGTEARKSRIEKCVEKIINGEGLHDKYKGKN